MSCNFPPLLPGGPFQTTVQPVTMNGAQQPQRVEKSDKESESDKSWGQGREKRATKRKKSSRNQHRSPLLSSAKYYLHMHKAKLRKLAKHNCQRATDVQFPKLFQKQGQKLQPTFPLKPCKPETTGDYNFKLLKR